MFDAAMRLAVGSLSPAGRSGRLTIAIFHRVLPEPDPLFPEELDRGRFDGVCAWLAAWFNVLPLDEAVQRLRTASLPPRALAITFDDGYADNHDVALPVLQAHGLCATFFIATGYLGGGRMWNDTLIEAVRRSGPAGLDVAGLGLHGASHHDTGSAAARRSAIDALLPAIKYLPPAARQSAVDAIAERVGAALPRDLMMTPDQVRALAAAGMQIGAHTVSHPILARVGDAEARAEMAASKAQLEDMLAQPVRLFAYPNGKPGADYSPRDVAIARSLGFDAAVSTMAGAARQGADLHQLPRFAPWSHQRAKFGGQMLRNLYAARSAPAATGC
ncbi:Polysaccharide deacetylase [Rubrivivax sp. A210]|uniref:polysaccharide deacetylase family protein n=1 Tax=Rubrivivax sp. A210 TaxID=2772301 RepID=UPI001919F0EF|nr:polysaccharide deacetylase family protein [Rubrivivax sp. A210]CAD5375216.1 Polysaccharide deacetylase [Rubrivivax sp. A210]